MINNEFFVGLKNSDKLIFWWKKFSVNGTTGEGTSLSIDERKKVTEAWSAAVKETKQHLMIQVGGAALKDVQELVSDCRLTLVNSLVDNRS